MWGERNFQTSITTSDFLINTHFATFGQNIIFLELSDSARKLLRGWGVKYGENFMRIKDKAGSFGSV